MPFRSCHPSIALATPLCLLLALSAPAAAGEPQERRSESGVPRESKSNPEFTIKVPVNVVPVNVTVTDKSGRPVKDLTAADFKLFEDGKRQRIQSFEIESSQPAVSPEPMNPAGKAAADTPALQPLQSSEGEPGKLISFFIDDLTERSVKFFGWAISALQEFMEEEMGPRDQVGVFSASGSVRIPFTGDRKLLRDRIGDLGAGKLDLLNARRNMSDVRAIRIVEGDLKGRVSDTEEFQAWRQYNVVQASIHRLLGSLRQHLRYLQHFRGSKSLVLLSEGFVPARPMRWRVDRMVDQALRSRVTLNAVDIKGLETAPLSTDIAFGDFPLESLAEDTGGIFYRASNDLVAGFRQIRDAQSFYYVLSYASSDQKAGGKYHRIRVEVDRPGLELSYRRGYFAPREELSQEKRKKEDLQLALEAPGRFDRIPLELAFRSSPLDRDRHRLSVFTKVNVAAIPFHQQKGRRTNLLNLVVAVYDENGGHVGGSEQKVELSLSESSYRTMLQRGFIAETEVEIPGGKYTVKVVARESNQTRMGSLQRAVGIPVAEAGDEARDLAAALHGRPIPLAGLEIGPLVLSQQLIPLADLSAGQQESLLASNAPLIFRDVQIHPLAAGPIDRRQPVTFYYRLHNLQHPRESRDMTARVQLTDESGLVSRFPLISLGEGMTQPWGQRKVTVVFNLSFKSVQPGKYRLTVMTRAPAAGGQSVIARTSVTVLQ